MGFSDRNRNDDPFDDDRLNRNDDNVFGDDDDFDFIDDQPAAGAATPATRGSFEFDDAFDDPDGFGNDFDQDVPPELLGDNTEASSGGVSRPLLAVIGVLIALILIGLVALVIFAVRPTGPNEPELTATAISATNAFLGTARASTETQNAVLGATQTALADVTATPTATATNTRPPTLTPTGTVDSTDTAATQQAESFLTQTAAAEDAFRNNRRTQEAIIATQQAQISTLDAIREAQQTQAAQATPVAALGADADTTARRDTLVLASGQRVVAQQVGTPSPSPSPTSTPTVNLLADIEATQRALIGTQQAIILTQRAGGDPVGGPLDATLQAIIETQQALIETQQAALFAPPQQPVQPVGPANGTSIALTGTALADLFLNLTQTQDALAGTPTGTLALVATPTPSALEDAGLFDQFGFGAVGLLALGLLGVIVMSRGLRGRVSGR